ncbi:MAG: hypothetical protein H6920_02025 [Sphingomonadaceae bacterium]|nr:hypothetical protein [Sphingomonadaceae bacterium]MCP5383110.1 hypothetical protein [Altererythrobacter sp.]MCP5390392.1 hypothetical protein [Sphingomonadaceae bacterium]MCP5393287.1 hypothetical protein [Sphingomonadaceae bacterium]
MFSAKTIRTTLAVAAGSLALALAGGAQAGVVVKSSGPSAAQYPPGKKLSDSGTVTLKTGDTLTILADGGTRVLKGPGTLRVSARGRSTRSTLATLTRRNDRSRVRTGASRGDGLATPNLWYLDLASSGTMCLPDAEGLTVTRPGGDQASIYMITSALSPDHMHVSFPAKVSLADWDMASMAVAEGTEYTVTGPDGVSNVVTFKILAEPASTAEALGTQLLENGCMAQLDLLTNTLM